MTDLDLEPPEPETPPGKVRADEDASGLTTYHDSWPVRIGADWSEFLEFFGYPPEDFEVVEDTVRVSKWQQSKGLADGSRDVIWLYSYRARFRRITPEDRALDLEADEARRWVRKWKPKAGNSQRKVDRSPVTFVHHQGDEQAGKSEAGGLDGLAEREARTLERSIEHLKALLRAGHNVEQIADLACGDRVEGIMGHYASQPRTTDTLRNQLKFARDMDLARTRAFAEFGLPIVKVYTPSNHGELRPGLGLSPLTSASDNLDLIIAESVRDVTDETPLRDQLTYLIPHDEWMTTFVLSGIPVGLTHGHKAGKGKPILKWVGEQRDYQHFHHGTRLQIIATGHLHHGHVEDAGGTWLIQPSALDGGSPYFEALSGTRSAGGALAYLVGEGDCWPWSNMTGV